MLTPEQLHQLKTDGFVSLPSFFDPKPLLDRTKVILNDFDPSSHPKVKFTTGENHVSDDYFLNSGDKIRFFFEPNATHFDKTTINKIGHALHVLDPVFKITSQSVRSITQGLSFTDPRVLQSMLILKQPRIGSAVPPHVDSTFLYTKPLSAIGFWFALEDCTLENACLYFAPGSHLKYPKLTRRFVRTDEGKTAFIKMDGDSEPGPQEYIPVPVKAGTLVLFSGSVHHKSDANTSDKSRWIYTFHVIEGEDEYPKDNWLQPTQEMPFAKLFE